MKKLLIFLLATLALSACEQPVVDENPSIPMPPNNEIWYTSSDNDVVIPNDANVFGANIVNNSYIDGKGVMTFDGDVTKIGYQAFLNCDRLTSVTIPDSVTTIGYQAFTLCTSLTEFKGKFASEDGRCLIIDGVLNSFAPYGLTQYTIPDSVTEIGEGAFLACTSLKNVTTPDSVTEIGNNAFYDCTSLTSVYCKATTPPSLGDSYVFDNNCSGRKIYVPASSVEAYKSARRWTEYASAIVGYDFENGVVVE